MGRGRAACDREVDVGGLVGECASQDKYTKMINEDPPKDEEKDKLRTKKYI